MMVVVWHLLLNGEGKGGEQTAAVVENETGLVSEPDIRD
jgi:hypothetical protein